MTDQPRIEEDPGTLDVGDLAADYVEGLLDVLDLDGDIEIEEEGGRYAIVVSAADPAQLEALARPETVSALQELTRLAVQNRTGEFARVNLDIGGSRDARTRELAGFVEQARVALDGGVERFDLEPMSSYERKLVHDLVAEHGLRSHSEGEGGGRHTVITSA